MKTAFVAVLFGSLALAVPAFAQTAGSQGQGGASGSTTGNLPQGSLAKERQGAIGDTPAGVRQGNQDDDQAAADSAATGKLPQNSLPAQREGAIGDQPAPVQQGGGQSSK